MLILTRSQIAGLLNFEEYVQVVEDAFRAHAEGQSLEPALMHVSAPDGEFHIKAGGLLAPEPYFALKANGGFFKNRERYNLPNIQGMVILCSGASGLPLAAMDSMEITIQRTGAATAIAARFLARPESAVCTMCGCGNQGRIQLRAMCHVLPIRRAFAFGLTLGEAQGFATAMGAELGIEITPTADLPAALAQSDVCVTCTPAKKALLAPGDVPPGMFIAAVGADSPDKQELDARLLPAASVFGDLLDQCAAVGEFHHGIVQGLVRREDFRGELGALITGAVRGRTAAEEITIYDSTGTAIQDAAAAIAAYRKAKASGIGVEIDLAG
ncbi:MAG: ornithine cyclodeaminase family protein [Candidatus Solibacter sp.]|nr:ornithine cyclodeaminase family protein [Candidatus Solibacter sp.]